MKSQLKEKMWLQSLEATSLVSKKQTTQNSIHIVVNQTLRKATNQKAEVLNQIKDLILVILKANQNQRFLRVIKVLDIKVIEA